MINKDIFLKVGKMGVISIFLSIFTYFLFFIIYSLSITNRFELIGLDFLYNFRGEIYEPPKEIVVVDINEQSLKELGRFGEWPRSYYATVIDYINEGGGKVIGFDILFSEESKIFPEGDNKLAEATGKAKNVYHSFIISNIPSTSPEEWMRSSEKKEKFVDLEVSKFSFGKNYCKGFSQRIGTWAVFPIKPILKEASGIGYINLILDDDRVVRKIQLLALYEDEFYPCFAFQIACSYLGIKKENIKIIPQKFIFLDKIRIPIDSNNQMFINYKTSYFRHIPFSLVLKKEIPASCFKDKIVLIGGTAEGLFDNVMTPMSLSMAGVDVHANVIYSIINGDFISFPKKYVIFFICLTFGVIMGWLLLRFSFLKGLVITSILIITYAITSLLLFNFKDIYLEIVRPTMVFMSIQIFSLITKDIVAKINKQ